MKAKLREACGPLATTGLHGPVLKSGQLRRRRPETRRALKGSACRLVFCAACHRTGLAYGGVGGVRSDATIRTLRARRSIGANHKADQDLAVVRGAAQRLHALDPMGNAV